MKYEEMFECTEELHVLKNNTSQQNSDLSMMRIPNPT